MAVSCDRSGGEAAIAAVTGLAPDIRWPNDLLIGTRKCGGILVETSAIASQSDAPAMLRYAVVGVGINVNHQSFPAELEALATSLRHESGRKWAREPILIEFLRALEKEVALLEAELRGTSTEARPAGAICSILKLGSRQTRPRG